MTAEKPMTVLAQKPADLLAYVPYLLGFHPHDSLVLVGIRDKRVVFGCRLVLPASSEQDPDFTEGLARLAEIATANHLTAGVIIGYGQASQAGPAVLQAQQLFLARGLTVVDALRVTDGRYWSYVCTDPGCCPLEGIVADPATSTIPARRCWPAWWPCLTAPRWRYRATRSGTRPHGHDQDNHHSRRPAGGTAAFRRRRIRTSPPTTHHSGRCGHHPGLNAFTGACAGRSHSTS